MTVDDFRQAVCEMAKERIAFGAYSDYLKHKRESDGTNPNKYLREEYLPILAVLNDKNIPGEMEIKLGENTAEPDACVGKVHVFEVVQALPDDEHKIRLEIASGAAKPRTHFEHASDHLQFPRAIIEAIELKHAMCYSDQRTLIVAFDGDYSFEDDDVIHRWIDDVRRHTSIGTFQEILLVERARMKVFKVF